MPLKRHGRRIVASLAPLLLVVCGVLLPATARAQAAASLKGVMTDKDTGGPLPFGNVVILNTKFGAMTREDGSYFIPNVPVGIYQVQASYMGYTSRTIDQVRIEAGRINELDIAMKSTVAVETQEIVVTGERALVEVDVTSTQRTVTAAEIASSAVTTVGDVLVQQTGVTIEDDEIHIRGGRSDETQYRIDGVVVKDLISGKSGGGDLHASSVSEINVITGGYNAEFGDALSGVIDIKTREGSDEYKNYTEWKSDHYPVLGQIYKNFSRDEFNARSEGPNPLTEKLLPSLGWNPPGSMTYFLNLNGVFTDTHLPGRASRDRNAARNDPDNPERTLYSEYENSLFGADYAYGSEFWSPRLSNDWGLFGKLTWKLGSKDKLNFTMNKSLSIDHGFDEPPIVRRDVTEETNYPWEWSQRLDHYYTYTKDTSIFSLTWNRLWSRNTSTQARMSRYVRNQRQSVFGRLWYGEEGYEPDDDFALPNCDEGVDGPCDQPFFIDSGDASRWHDRYVASNTTAFDLTRKIGKHHTLKGGWENSFQNVQYIDIRFPWVSDPNNLGGSHDLYDVNPAVGAMFLQNQFDFEGFIGNIGMRLDYWFPGNEADNAVSDTSRANYDATIEREYLDQSHQFLGGRRYKAKILPRLAVSHPMTDHTHLFLNYGQFLQWPSYFYVYSKISSVSSEDFPLVGNLNLNPELAVQYEMGLRHEFSRTFSGDATFFYKDIYDYPTSVRFTRPGQGPIFIYINNDFARSRGFELQLKKRKDPFLSGTASYSYSVATGKASDPNQTQILQEAEGSFAELGLEEGYLWWNRPHKFSLGVDYRIDETTDAAKVPSVLGRKLPRDWNVNAYLLVRSGRAYTPEDRNGNETGKKFSKNAPLNATVDLRTEKGFRLPGGRRLRTSLEARNVFNSRAATRVDPSTGKVPTIGQGQVDPVPDTPDLAEAREAQIIRYQDPSWYAAPRTVWFGIGVEW